MAFLKNKQLLILKVESVAGTGVTPVAADFDVRVYELEHTPTIEMDGDLKYATGDHSEGPDIAGARMGQISCTVKLSNSGTATTAPEFYKFAQACGAVVDTGSPSAGTTLTPMAKGDIQTHTAWIVDIERAAAPTSTAYKYAGVMGEWTIGAEGIGKPVQANFTFSGKYTGSADLDASATTALAALTGEDTVIPYVFLNWTATFGSETLKISSFSLTAGNSIEPQICQSEATGYDFFGVTARAPRLQINPLQQTKTAWDTLNDWLSNTTASITLTSADSIPFILYAPAAQIISAAEAVREGLKAYDLNFKLQRNGVTGTPVDANIPVESPWEILIGARA